MRSSRGSFARRRLRGGVLGHRRGGQRGPCPENEGPFRRAFSFADGSTRDILSEDLSAFRQKAFHEEIAKVLARSLL